MLRIKRSHCATCPPPGDSLTPRWVSDTVAHLAKRLQTQHCCALGLQQKRLVTPESSRPLRNLPQARARNTQGVAAADTKECCMPHGAASHRKVTKLQILIWAPQLVCYARLLILALGLSSQNFVFAGAALLVSLTLDGLDGYLARRNSQASEFGAFLDVAVDIVCRGLLWAAAIPGPISAVPITLEAITFACTHAVSAANWKEDYFASAPSWIAAVMRNGFKTLLGCFAIAGLMGLPLWLYLRQLVPDSVLCTWAVGAPLVAGRLLCAAVECWVVVSHMSAMLTRDIHARTNQA